MSYNLVRTGPGISVLTKIVSPAARVETTCALPYICKRFRRRAPEQIIYRIKGLTGEESRRHLVRTKDPVNDLPDKMTRHVENYPSLCFKVKGFDMVLVESLATAIHRLMQRYLVKVDKVYAEPTYERHLKELKGSLDAKIEDISPYFMMSYHTRVIKVREVSAIQLPILCQVLMQLVPQSVDLQVDQFTEKDTEILFKRRVGLERLKETITSVKK